MPNAQGSLGVRHRRPAPRNQVDHPTALFSCPPPESHQHARSFPVIWQAYFPFRHPLRSQLGGGHYPIRHNFLLFEPRLKHQYVPQSKRPIALPGKMFLPPLSQVFGFEKSLLTQTRFAQEALAPDAQWAAQPFGYRRPKAFLGTLHESLRDILVQNSSQQPFALISS